MPGLGIVPVPNGKQDTPHWGNSFTARVTQVVYAGGAVRSGIRLAELGREMAQLDVERNRQEVRFLLAGYYLDLSKLGNQMEVVRQNIALTQTELDQMRARRGLWHLHHHLHAPVGRQHGELRGAAHPHAP